MRIFYWVAAVLVMISLVQPAAAGVITIDDFGHANSVANLVVDDLTTLSEDEDGSIPVDNAIGGVRFGSLEVEEPLFAGEVASMEVNLPSAPGQLVIHAFSPLHKLPRGKLRYGWQTVSGQPLDQKWDDLTAMVFTFDGFAAWDQTISVRLWSEYGTAQEQSPSVTKTLDTVSTSLVFPLPEFTAQMLNLGDVDGIEVTFDAIPAGQNLTIDEIRVVPEPATLGLVALSLAAFMRRRLSAPPR
jgi:PEP-CTERM motif-containing protein